ncbi:hypothetical protein vBPpSSYP_55 [Pseudomonas phage vB_PpS_SYP]|nr:hypothetical protein vBPpSSYP_55 [Pseudomonas phage vB_PpS_SYP]
MKPGDIVRCTNTFEYRVNFVGEEIVGLTYVHWSDAALDYVPNEYCTYYDTPIKYVQEIVREA